MYAVEFSPSVMQSRRSAVPPLFNLYAEHIMRNAGLDESQARIKIGGETSTTSDKWMIPL